MFILIKYTPPATKLFIRLNMGTHRVIELNCNNLPFSIQENERFPRWMNLAKQRTNTSSQCHSHCNSSAMTVVRITFSLNIATSKTDLINTSNETDRSTYMLRQHRAIYSWFRDIQYARHVVVLLIYWSRNAATSRGKSFVLYSTKEGSPNGRGIHIYS